MQLCLISFVEYDMIILIEYPFSELIRPTANAMAVNRRVWGEIPLPPVLERKMLINREQIPLRMQRIFSY